MAGVFPNSSNYPNSYSPILTDLGADPGQPQCALPGVSWVVPDGNWSDHGGEDSSGAGPSWVAAIVNAVGQSTCKNPDGTSYWATTAILIVWDDWGGWYDHVTPWHCSTSSGKCTGYNDGESGSYTYGFRVPMLVVSAYTGTYNSGNGTWSGYISGACGTGFPPCPNEAPGLVHDFGSILNFIEYAFGVNQTPIGEINSQYHYADYYAPDVYTGAGNCTQKVGMPILAFRLLPEQLQEPTQVYSYYPANTNLLLHRPLRRDLLGSDVSTRRS